MGQAERPTCIFLFEQSCLNGSALQDEVFRCYPGGDCEQASISSLSPGPVLNDEVLTRLIVHPIHYDANTAAISPFAFNDATTLDLSVFREAKASDEEIQLSIDEIRATGKSRVPTQDRLVNLVMQATAAELRACKFDDDGMQMCRVYDTAMPGKPAHASVFTPIRARKGSGQRQVRRKLHMLFSLKQISADKYRSLAFEGRSA